jgi:hypothetical protein
MKTLYNTQYPVIGSCFLTVKARDFTMSCKAPHDLPPPLPPPLPDHVIFYYCFHFLLCPSHIGLPAVRKTNQALMQPQSLYTDSSPYLG